MVEGKLNQQSAFSSQHFDSAPLCRVGRSMNLRKQVEPLCKPSFRLPRTEACTPRGVAILLDETLAQTSLPPSRAKQGTRTLEGSYRFEVQRSRFKVPGSNVEP